MVEKPALDAEPPVRTTQPTAPLPEPRCSLCGGPNGCVPAATGTFSQPCWCANACFSKDLLERVPAAAAGRACICRACAESAA